MAKTNWDRYFQSQMQDAELRTLVEAERAALEIGHRLATLRRKRKLSQTQVVAALKRARLRSRGLSTTPAMSPSKPC